MNIQTFLFDVYHCWPICLRWADLSVEIKKKKKKGSHGHDDVIKWKHFLRYWPFVRGICRTLVNSPHKGQGCGALMFSLTCAWINDWVNNSEAGDLRRHHAHHDVIVMDLSYFIACWHKSDNFHDSQTNMFKINLCPWTDITWVLWHRK